MWLAIAVVCGDLLVALAVLNALRLVFLRREPPPRSQWSSPWLSLQLGLVTLALVGTGLAAEPLVGWSHGAVRAGLSAGGPFVP